MNSIYDYPKYYEIAFSFRDILAEVDAFEKCFLEYADIPIKHVLEIGCGNSPHLEELLKRGYIYTGLDTSKAMLAYSSNKAAAIGGKASFFLADMVSFSIPEKYDFAFINLGSLSVKNTAEIISHFHSVADVLNRGGLYLLDWCVHFPPFADQDDSWTIIKGKTQVTTYYSERLVDPVEQLVEETITFDVIESDKPLNLSVTTINRIIFPQEFLLFVQEMEQFEFIGWWNGWDLEKPLRTIKDPQMINRPITLLRRR